MVPFAVIEQPGLIDTSSCVTLYHNFNDSTKARITTDRSVNKINYLINIPFDGRNNDLDLARIIKEIEQNSFINAEENLGRLAVIIGINFRYSIDQENNKIISHYADLLNSLKPIFDNLPFLLAIIGFYWKPHFRITADIEGESIHDAFTYCQNWFLRHRQDAPTIKPEIELFEKNLPRSIIPFGEIRNFIAHNKYTIKYGEYLRMTFPEHSLYHVSLDADLKSLRTENNIPLFSFYDAELLKHKQSTGNDVVLYCGGFRFAKQENILYYFNKLTNAMLRTCWEIFPRAIYYSEANCLILIPPQDYYLLETYGPGQFEMKQMVAQLANRAHSASTSSFIFNPDGALITTVPSRMRNTRTKGGMEYTHDAVIDSSTGLIAGWTKEDFEHFRTISQAPLQPLKWANLVLAALPATTLNKELINKTLCAIFSMIDPISVALDVHEKTSKYSRQNFTYYLQGECEREIEDETIELHLNELRILGDSILKKIIQLAKQTRTCIVGFLKEKFCFDPSRNLAHIGLRFERLFVEHPDPLYKALVSLMIKNDEESFVCLCDEFARFKPLVVKKTRSENYHLPHEIAIELRLTNFLAFFLEYNPKIAKDLAILRLQNYNGLTIAHQLVKLHKNEILKKILAKYPELNYIKDENAFYPVHYAILAGNQELGNTLLKNFDFKGIHNAVMSSSSIPDDVEISYKPEDFLQYEFSPLSLALILKREEWFAYLCQQHTNNLVQVTAITGASTNDFSFYYEDPIAYTFFLADFNQRNCIFLRMFKLFWKTAESNLPPTFLNNIFSKQKNIYEQNLAHFYAHCLDIIALTNLEDIDFNLFFKKDLTNRTPLYVLLTKIDLISTNDLQKLLGNLKRQHIGDLSEDVNIILKIEQEKISYIDLIVKVKDNEKFIILVDWIKTHIHSKLLKVLIDAANARKIEIDFSRAVKKARQHDLPQTSTNIDLEDEDSSGDDAYDDVRDPNYSPSESSSSDDDSSAQGKDATSDSSSEDQSDASSSQASADNDAAQKLPESLIKTQANTAKKRNIATDDEDKSVLKSLSNPASSDKRSKTSESMSLGAQLGWNCFDISVGINDGIAGRQRIVDFALSKAGDLNFRKLLVPEIRHAAALTVSYMLLEGNEDADEVQQIFALDDLFQLHQALEPDDKINKWLLEKNIEQILQNVEQIEFPKGSLPESLRTPTLKEIVLGYQNAHEDMKPIVAECSEMLGFAEGKRKAIQELDDFFRNEANLEAYPLVYEKFSTTRAEIFTPFEQAFDEFCISQDTYCTYIQDYYGKENWFAFQRKFALEDSTSMVDVIAILLNKIIVIYQDEGNQEKEIYRTKNPGIAIIEIKYDGTSHFYKRSSAAASILPLASLLKRKNAVMQPAVDTQQNMKAKVYRKSSSPQF